MNWTDLIIWGLLAYFIIVNVMDRPNSPLGKMGRKLWQWIKNDEE